MIVRDENTATDALAIVEKYEAFVTYLYPILQNAPRRHGVLRDTVLAALFTPQNRNRYRGSTPSMPSSRWADSANLIRSLEIGGRGL